MGILHRKEYLNVTVSLEGQAESDLPIGGSDDGACVIVICFVTKIDLRDFVHTP